MVFVHMYVCTYSYTCIVVVFVAVVVVVFVVVVVVFVVVVVVFLHTAERHPVQHVLKNGSLNLSSTSARYFIAFSPAIKWQADVGLGMRLEKWRKVLIISD